MSTLIVNPLNDSESEDEQNQESEIKQITSENEGEENDVNPLMDSDSEESQSEQSLENMTNQQKIPPNQNDDESKLEYHVCQTQLVWDQQNVFQNTKTVCSCDDVKLQQIESGYQKQTDSNIIALGKEILGKDQQIQKLQQQIQDIQKSFDDQNLLTTTQLQEINELKNINLKLRDENDSLKNDIIMTQKELHRITLLLYQDQKQDVIHRSKTSTDFAQKQENYEIQPSNATLNDNNLPPLSPHEQSIVKVTSRSQIPDPFTSKSAKNNNTQESLSSTTRKSFQTCNQIIQQAPQTNGAARKPKLINQQKSLQDLIHKAQLTQLFLKSKNSKSQWSKQWWRCQIFSLKKAPRFRTLNLTYLYQIIFMGSYKSKNHKVDISTLPVVDPEPDYIVKTRQPMPSSNWQLNILRGKREDELRGLSYAYARRKCHKDVNTLLQCEKEYGSFWAAFDCQAENHDMNECLEHEFNVEMDKLRRNMKMNTEWWWKDLYDENGEVGDQAKWIDEYWLWSVIRNYRDQLYSIIK